MYKKILSMPIFQGIGEEKFDRIISRIPLEFAKYSAGEKIESQGNRCENIILLLSGKVRFEIPIYYGECEFNLSFQCIPCEELSLRSLCGISNSYNFDIIAAEATELMIIDKKTYLSIVMSDEIAFMNFSNIISSYNQKGIRCLRSEFQSPKLQWLELVLSLVIKYDARNIRILAINERARLFVEEFEKELALNKRNYTENISIVNNQIEIKSAKDVLANSIE